MITERKLKRFQVGLLLAAGSLLLLYWFGYRALSAWVNGLDKPAVAAWQRLVAIAEDHAGLHSLNSEELTTSLDQMEQAVGLLRKTSRSIRERIKLEPATRERLEESFQLLEFDQHRLLISDELRRAASAKKVQLAGEALKGLPDFSNQPQPSLLWAQLSFARQLLDAAIASSPSAISNLTMLPGVTHRAGATRSPALQEFPMRLVLTGSPENLLHFLTSLPLRGEELSAAGLKGMKDKTQVFVVKRILLRNSVAYPTEATLDIVVSGFCEPPESDPTR